MKPPDADKRRLFFSPLLIEAALKSPRLVREKPKTPPPLPRAPTPPPTPVSEEAARKLYEQEERTLRELRIFLRDMCKKLANNKMLVYSYNNFIKLVNENFFLGFLFLQNQ